MSDCYLCGKADSHTNDCPKFVYAFPSILQSPSTTGLQTLVTFKIKEKTWRVDVIKPGDVIPEWATHCWFIDGYTLANKSLTLQERAAEWEIHCKEDNLDEPDHTLEHKRLMGGVIRIYPLGMTYDLLIFGPLEK